MGPVSFRPLGCPMKVVGLLTAVAAALLLSDLANGTMCTGGSLDAWPDSGPVPHNVQFLLQGVSGWSNYVQELQAGDVFLMSDSGRVDLLLGDRFKGEQLSQVFLRPATPLAVGSTYWLMVARDSAGNMPHVKLPYRWLVEDRTDREQPKFLEGPMVDPQPFRPNYSNGRSVRFLVRATEPALLRVSLGPPGDVPLGRSEFLLRSIKERPFQLYDGSCGRNYPLRESRRILALFSLIDAAGHESTGLPLRREFRTSFPELVP